MDLLERPDPDDARRISKALGSYGFRARAAAGHGAPSNRRWVVETTDGRSAFVKIAAYDYTAEWLRKEHDNYTALQGLACMPRLLGWHDDGEHPALAIEDLSGASWPPPWDGSRIEAVLSGIDEIRETPPPPVIDEVAERQLFDIREGWDLIRADPTRALGLGLFEGSWLSDHLDDLEAAADAAVIDGDVLVHADIRSDNLCFRDGRALFVDWNWACVGHPDLDVAGWLPSLTHEGGPMPWEILPGRGELAALIAGFMIEHAGREPIPQAPHVRQLQLDQGKVALAWALKELGLPTPS
jgi:hypothetical protein